MTEKERAIARAFLECEQWELHGGMLLWQGGWSARVGDGFVFNDAMGPLLPDVTDPATLGCILQVVRDAHGMPFLSLVSFSTTRAIMGWRVQGFEQSFVHLNAQWAYLSRKAICKTEAEALLYALQAAPKAS